MKIQELLDLRAQKCFWNDPQALEIDGKNEKHVFIKILKNTTVYLYGFERETKMIIEEEFSIWMVHENFNIWMMHPVVWDFFHRLCLV